MFAATVCHCSTIAGAAAAKHFMHRHSFRQVVSVNRVDAGIVRRPAPGAKAAAQQMKQDRVAAAAAAARAATAGIVQSKVRRPVPAAAPWKDKANGASGQYSTD